MKASPLEPQGYTFPLPQELVELIIDYVVGLEDAGKTIPLRTLCACSLVATGWRTRAQWHIFRYATLQDVTQLYRFAEVLRASPHLAAYVDTLVLARKPQARWGTQYVPNSVEVLFPTVLGGLLPSLRCIKIEVRRSLQVEFVDYGDKDQDQAQHTSDQRRLLPHIPIHPRFPLLLSAFSGISELHLSTAVFQTFNDFARILHAFRKLRALFCFEVNWITPGIILPAFMTRPGNDPFLPFLETLSMVVSSKHAEERLLSALAHTASLRRFTFAIPYVISALYGLPSVDPALGGRSGIDLSPFGRLNEIAILGISPDSDDQVQSLVLSSLHDVLASWNSNVSRSLSLWINYFPYSTVGEKVYTRQGYLSFLEDAGRMVEKACISNGGLSSLFIHLEIPFKETSPLEELEREGMVRFRTASKAKRLTVRAYRSDTDGSEYP